MPTHLSAFVVAALLWAVLPGAGQALMLRQTLDSGRWMAWATVAGTCTGLLIWSISAAAGLSAILLANPGAYTTLRIAGGVVLIALGANTLLSLRRPTPAISATQTGRRANYWSGYVAGLVTNLGNPKSGVFAISLLPQFINKNGSVFISGTALGGLWALVTACWYVLFIWAVVRGRTLVSKRAIHRILPMVTGTVLLLLGGAAIAIGIYPDSSRF